MLLLTYYLSCLNSKNISALWGLCDLISLMFNSCMWNVFAYLISKENFLCRFFMHFANLWLSPCLLWGGCLAETLLSKFFSHHCVGFSVFHHNLCLGWGGEGVHLSNNTFTTSFLVSGGIWTGSNCLSFIPLLPDGNQLIIHSYRFLDMEQAKFKFASCAVGRNVHY